jgi:hypothetical protein
MTHNAEYVPPPHQWDGTQWTCLACGHKSPDPCDCLCHNAIPGVPDLWPDPWED